MNQHFSFNLKDSCELIFYRPKDYEEVRKSIYIDLLKLSQAKINLMFNKGTFTEKCVIAEFLFNNNRLDFRFEKWVNDFDLLCDYSMDKTEMNEDLDRFIKRTAMDDYENIKKKIFSDKYGKIICKTAEKVYDVYMNNKEGK